ncbi:MAG: S8 family serine peptidase [Thermoplasmatota archaeon]
MSTKWPLRGVACLLVAGFVLAALGVPAAATPIAGDIGEHGAPADYLVGLVAGARFDAARFVAAGADVVDWTPAIGVAHVRTADPAALPRALGSSLAFIERDAATTTSSTSWDATGWQSTGWSSTGWSSTGWQSIDNASTGWSSTGWSATGWGSTGWTSTGWSSTSWGTAFQGYDPGYDYQWGLGALNAPTAWSRAHGTGSHIICFLDTGVDASHPDIAANLWTAADGSHGWNFVANTSDTSDDGGHGTLVAGIAAGVAGDAFGIAGVSQSKIMVAKVLDGTGVGTEDNLAKGITWCADHGANILSMSLTTTTNSAAVSRAVTYAHDTKGALLVAAAGNDGPCDQCVLFPAAYDKVIAVSAIGPDDKLAPFSARGDKMDLTAPGVDILGPLPGGLWRYASGTSMSTPFVAGAAALLWDAKPTLKNDDVKGALEGTAKNIGDAHSFGHGLIDVSAALTKLGIK